MTTQLPNKAWVLRTCGPDGMTYNGFRWPDTVGSIVKAPDWDPTPYCGCGLHGLLDGWGDYGLLDNSLNAIWQIVEVDRDKCVQIDSHKVKFPECKIIYSGNVASALTRMGKYQTRLPRTNTDLRSTSSGFRSTAASVGKYSTAASNGEFSTAASNGKYSMATSNREYSAASSIGDNSRAASNGDYSKAACIGFNSLAASIGTFSMATATGNYSRAASSGNKTVSMVAGFYGLAKTGPDGTIALTWWDAALKRPRIAVGYRR